MNYLSWRSWAVLIAYIVAAPVAGAFSPWLGAVIAMTATFAYFIFVQPLEEAEKKRRQREIEEYMRKQRQGENQ